QPGATAKLLKADIKLADNVPPGVYPARLGSAKGISAPFLIEVDEVAAQPFGPQVTKLPALLQGVLAGSTVLQTSFAGKKGDRLVIDVEARRIGSAIDPVVRLFDARRIQVAWAQGAVVLGGDARLETVLP